LLFQEAEFSRIIIIFFSQSFIIVVFCILGFKLIKRKRERAQIALFLFYIILSFGLILNIAFVLLTPTNNEVLLRTLYIFSSFFIAFPFVFNVLFLNILLKMEEVFTLGKMAVIVVVYGVVCFSLYLVPEGIVFSSNWVPTYSFPLFIVLYIYFTVFMTVPTVFYSIRLYRLVRAQNLKKRYQLYMIGIVIMLATIYGGIYFITTNNQLFKTIYSVFAFIFEITSGLLVYNSLGKNL